MIQLTFLYLALVTYLIAGVFSGLARFKKANNQSRLSIILSVIGIMSLVLFIIIRADSNGFLPFASRFESLIIFALAVQLIGLIIYLFSKYNLVKAGTDGISIILLSAALFGIGFTSGKVLNPLLNSPFFIFHILISFAGYGAITGGLVFSIMMLFDRQIPCDTFIPRRLAFLSLLLLGTGILIGSMWADNSWGSYWSWDPKESWALLNWAILMVYVHISRRNNHYWLAALFFGFSTAVMLFTFIGINLLKLGLHRY